MKTWIQNQVAFAFATLLPLASPAFAQTIETLTLTEKKVSTSKNEVILVRNEKTPNTVTLSMDIPYGEKVCTLYDSRMVYGQDSSCGYDIVSGTRTECSDSQRCEVSLNGVCQSYSSHEVCGSVPYEYTVTRSCYHSEVYCAEFGIRNYNSKEQVVLDFSALRKLRGGKEQRFRLIGSQARVGSSNDKYSVFVVDGAGEQIETTVKEFLESDRVVFH